MLDEFTVRAAELHLPLFETYGRFQRASHALSAGDYAEARRLADEALATGRRSHGVNAEIAYAGAWFRLALDLGRLPETLPESERMLAANPRLRMWQVAVARALVETDRRDDAEAHLADLVGPDGVHMRDNQMFLPATCTLAEVVAAIDDRDRAAVIQHALEPYADRIATSGLAGISIGPVSGYAGLAAYAAGDLDAAERLLDDAIARNVADGTRPHEARARLARARVHAARGEHEAAAAEERAARELAASIGLVLRD
jgi:tetratricopeptide (TPR) repeat protein